MIETCRCSSCSGDTFILLAVSDKFNLSTAEGGEENSEDVSHDKWRSRRWIVIETNFIIENLSHKTIETIKLPSFTFEQSFLQNSKEMRILVSFFFSTCFASHDTSTGDKVSEFKSIYVTSSDSIQFRNISVVASSIIKFESHMSTRLLVLSCPHLFQYYL